MKRLVQVGLPDLLPAWELLIYFVVYSTMCVISVGMSAPTGLFVPGMLMVSTPSSRSALFTVCGQGGSLGRLVGVVIYDVFGGYADPGQCALVGLLPL